jgi:serine protease AprX
MLAVVAALALAIPLGSASAASRATGTTYVSPALLALADKNSKGTVDVIIQSADGTDGARQALNRLGLNGDAKKGLDLVGAVVTSIKVSKLDELAATDGLIVTPDATVETSGGPEWASNQLWPYVAGSANLWPTDRGHGYGKAAPTIAIVDSGVQSRSDFGKRLLASVDLGTRPNNSPGDGRGHGTFVAGIAASSATGYSGASPAANLLSIDVMDDEGVGSTSDIIKACQWILDNQDKYNIRVANFSLHSAINAPFYYDPLDKAVESLWLNGIVVVVAAGNYGTPGAPSGVLYSPSNDPFVITVGAADLHGTVTTTDDTTAPWSAWGYTMDGFAKPEVSAPGRYMVGPVPDGSTLASERASDIVAPGYMQLSGTSFAAPVVAGAAADILARHPKFTPDDVKGALMLTARTMPGAGLAGGVGEITASASTKVDDPPNPNAALDQFVKPGKGHISKGDAFDSAGWVSSAKTSASWNSASWNSASWNTASWNSASWNSASWNSASWNSASWNSASWNSASWNSASWNSDSYEDAADEDTTSRPYLLGPAALAALFADPLLAPDPSTLPATSP